MLHVLYLGNRSCVSLEVLLTIGHQELGEPIDPIRPIDSYIIYLLTNCLSTTPTRVPFKATWEGESRGLLQGHVSSHTVTRRRASPPTRRLHHAARKVGTSQQQGQPACFATLASSALLRDAPLHSFVWKVSLSLLIQKRNT